MKTFKEKCLELRASDHTLPEIVKITGRPKTSVYFHIRKLPLSAGRLRLIRQSYGERIRKFPLERKGKSLRPFKKFACWDRHTVFLVSHMLFDGELQRAWCAYNNRSVALIERVEQAMKAVYDYEPKRYRNHSTGVIRTSYYNVALGAYMRQKGQRLLEAVHTLPKQLKREFLRAFFDDEGCMDFRPEENRRRVRGYQKDVAVLAIIQELLLDLKIESRIVQPNEVIVAGRRNLAKFQREVGFSPGVYINGNRSNSIWKRHLEKREILKHALSSYKSKG
jgi:hypothetical protein